MLYHERIKEFFDSCDDEIRFAPMLAFTSSFLGCELCYPDPYEDPRFFDTYIGVCAVYVHEGAVRTMAAIEVYVGGETVESKLKIFGGDYQIANASFFLKREYEVLSSVSHEREIISIEGVTLSKSQMMSYIEGLKCKI